jgi:hypothetical protein
MNAHRKTCLAAGFTAALGFIIACGGSQQQASRPPVGKGQLAIELVDAPSTDVQEIWVNVTSVRAHAAGTGWVTISDATMMPVKLDLLKLQSASLPLGLANLPPGTVTQIRLLVAADGNEVLVAGSKLPLKVPSGFESGIKIHGPWDIVACSRSTVTLDFDGKKSIQTHPTGSGQEWILRPVIRARPTVTADVGCGETDGGTGEGGDLPPVLVPAGGACTLGSECFSGTCSASVCTAGGAGAPCQVATDCSSNLCGEDATCAAPPAAAGAGGACTIAAGCLSNACIEGLCGPGDQGAVCSVNADCMSTSCSQGFCAPLAAQ